MTREARQAKRAQRNARERKYSPSDKGTRRKVKDLIALALDKGTPDKECVAAAMQAVTIIDKYDLLSSPLDGLLDIDSNTLRAGKTIFDVVTDPKVRQSIKEIGRQFSRLRRS